MHQKDLAKEHLNLHDTFLAKIVGLILWIWTAEKQIVEIL